MHQGRHQEYTQMIAKTFAVRETQLVKCFAVPGISLEHTKQNKIFSFNNLTVEGCVHGLESAGSSEMWTELLYLLMFTLLKNVLDDILVMKLSHGRVNLHRYYCLLVEGDLAPGMVYVIMYI